MDGTKLNTLLKSENLSAWQHEQITRGFKNKEMFMQLNVKDLDPWAHFQIPEQRAIRNIIPNCPMKGTKKNMNNSLQDQKIIRMQQAFAGKPVR